MQASLRGEFSHYNFSYIALRTWARGKFEWMLVMDFVHGDLDSKILAIPATSKKRTHTDVRISDCVGAAVEPLHGTNIFKFKNAGNRGGKLQIIRWLPKWRYSMTRASHIFSHLQDQFDACNTMCFFSK